MNSRLRPLFAFCTLLVFCCQPARAAKITVVDQDSSTDSRAAVKASFKSAKKASADAVHLASPQVIEEGDSSIGLRANQGAIYGGAPIVSFDLEHMVKPNFGVGLLVGYSSYSTTISAGPVSGELDSTAWTTALIGSFHANVFKVRNLDTYLTAGFGHAFFNSEFKSNGGDFSPSVGVEGAANFFVAYVNARYFIDSAWGFTASVGTGLGTLGLGVDYLF